MKIGLPNNPKRELDKEILWISANKFDYIDLFLEEGKTSLNSINPQSVKDLLKKAKLSATGHMPWYIPIGSPIKAIREAAVSETKKYLTVFSEIETEKVAIHAHWCHGSFCLKEMIDFQTESLEKITRIAKSLGVTPLLELTDSKEDAPSNIKKILDSIPQLRFLLDIGHANLHGRKPVDYIRELSSYISHVHMHDNSRDLDLHLPIGCGNIDWEKTIKALKQYYDGTITLEIFSRSKDYVLLSRDKLQKYWADL